MITTVAVWVVLILSVLALIRFTSRWIHWGWVFAAVALVALMELRDWVGQ